MRQFFVIVDRSAGLQQAFYGALDICDQFCWTDVHGQARLFESHAEAKQFGANHIMSHEWQVESA